MRPALRFYSKLAITASVLAVLLFGALQYRASADVEQGIALDSQCYMGSTNCPTCPSTGRLYFCASGWVPDGQSPGICNYTFYFSCPYSKGISCGSKKDCTDPTQILGMCGGTYSMCRTDSP